MALTNVLENKDYIALNRSQPGLGLCDFTAERYEQFCSQMTSFPRFILDVGCNNGEGGKVLKNQYPNAILAGVECVPERALEASKIYDLVMETLANEIPLPSNTATDIVAGEFIEHLTLDDTKLFLQEAYRILKPNGYIILTTPNPEYIKLKLRNRKVTDDPSHLCSFAVEELAAELRNYGFQDVSYEGSGRVSRFLGKSFPVFNAYGSYLIRAKK